jgi:hypothetical protein
MNVDKRLDLYIENGWNVLLKGRHGVGKTAMVKAAFERHNLKWRYFSAATMDPWVDFIGVPRERDTENGPVLDLVRPPMFQDGSVEAIFMDELNRAPAKVRNAVMELIQFRSINGKHFPNLRCIWAAVNPDEDDEEEDFVYDTEVLDPAQEDRFQIQIEIPYKPDIKYFRGRYGDAGGGAVEWWNELDKVGKDEVSPRRLEYAIQVYASGGDLRDVLGKKVNVSQLRVRLNSGSMRKKLKDLMSATEEERSAEFSNINFATDAVDHIVKKDEYIKEFLGYIPLDVVSDLFVTDDAHLRGRLVKNASTECVSKAVKNIVKANLSTREIRSELQAACVERGIDLASEEDFLEAVEEGLATVGGTSTDRFHALHKINAKYNNKASLETYVKTVEFLAKLASHSQKDTLFSDKRPVGQIGKKLINRMNERLVELGVSEGTLEIWSTLKTKGDFPGLSSEKLNNIEKYISGKGY